MTSAHLPEGRRQTYYLRSFGCQMNAHDAERLRAQLAAYGLAAVATPDEADVLIYNTCTVRESADQRLAGHLGAAARLKRDDPERLVLVTGCLPQSEQEGFFSRYPFVDGALGPQNVWRLPELLALPPGVTPRGFFNDGPEFSGDLPGLRERPYQAWVQVMSGCTNNCSYCIVPTVRGPERSREMATIVAEVRSLVADGVKEVTLLGQNVNAYGADLSSSRATFAELLAALDAVDGLERLRFMTSHPKDLSDELIAAVAHLPSVCEHVHLPAQAGSDRVLQAMNRRYTAEHYLGLVAKLRRALPEVSITTDLIAGFPGETDDDFAATLALVEEARFDGAFTFVYSPRSGTPAADLDEQIGDEVKVARVQQLVALTQRLANESHQRLIGRRVEILVEGASRDGALWRGRSRQNVTVNAAGEAQPGAIVEVEIDEATSTTLRGRLIG